jgi:hypothetical protein
MLCTRCAAFAGCWTTHQMTNAIAAHLRMFESFTAASLEAQTAPSCQFLNLSPKPRLDGDLVVQAGTALAMPVRQQVCPLLAGATHEPV